MSEFEKVGKEVWDALNTAGHRLNYIIHNFNVSIHQNKLIKMLEKRIKNLEDRMETIMNGSLIEFCRLHCRMWENDWCGCQRGNDCVAMNILKENNSQMRGKEQNRWFKIKNGEIIK